MPNRATICTINEQECSKTRLKTFSRSTIAIILILAGCAQSAPYVTATKTDTDGIKTETVCTHKTYLIPWYAGIAAGFFTFKGDKVCEDKRAEVK